MCDLINPPARMTVPATPRRRGKPLAHAAGGLRERAWWLLRTVRRTTLDELLLTLADGTEGDAESNLRKYLRALERAGVLRRSNRRAAGQAPTSNGHVIWILARDLGPLAPVWREAQRAVWDPNACDLLPLDAPAAPAAPTTPEDSTDHA